MCKKCNTCNIEKPLTDFSKSKTNKDGYKNKCKKCVAEYSRKHRGENIESEKERSKIYYMTHKIEKKNYAENNREKIKIRGEKYRKDNKEVISAKRKEYRLNNLEKVNKQRATYTENRLKRDNLFKLRKSIKGVIRDSFRRKDLSKGNKQSVLILGCSIIEFKAYLESKFEPWMNWENYGKYNGELNYGWDIDHITPISTAVTEEDIIKLNHYTNLQPLCSYTNRVIKRLNE